MKTAHGSCFFSSISVEQADYLHDVIERREAKFTPTGWHFERPAWLRLIARSARRRANAKANQAGVEHRV